MLAGHAAGVQQVGLLDGHLGNNVGPALVG
jgi:hypothetical protein